MNSADLSTRDLTSCRLKLSDELIFAPQQHAGSTYYHIEAPSKGQFYRVGYPEYVFLSLLDGRTNLAQAVTLSARALGAAGPFPTAGAGSGPLAAGKRPGSIRRRPRDGLATCRGLALSKTSDVLRSLNPFWMKIPLLRPDRLLVGLLPVTGWLLCAVDDLARTPADRAPAWWSSRRIGTSSSPART